MTTGLLKNGVIKMKLSRGYELSILFGEFGLPSDVHVDVQLAIFSPKKKGRILSKPVVPSKYDKRLAKFDELFYNGYADSLDIKNMCLLLGALASVGDIDLLEIISKIKR